MVSLFVNVKRYNFKFLINAARCCNLQFCYYLDILKLQLSAILWEPYLLLPSGKLTLSIPTLQGPDHICYKKISIVVKESIFSEI